MGVERRVIDRALAAVRPPDVDNGQRAARPRARSAQRQLGKLPRVAQRRRLLAFLARRGYTGDIAHGALVKPAGLIGGRPRTGSHRLSAETVSG